MILVAKIFKRFFLISLLFLGACSKDKEILSISGQIFGTFYDIKFEASQKDFTKVNDEINNVFISINECCSTYKNDSLVSLKRDKKNTDSVKQEINDYFQDVIKISVRANKTARGFILFENYDYFNAVAKGYAVDVLSSKFNELSIKNFFINIGGEIRAEGKKNNTFWKIGIENPSLINKVFLNLLNLSKIYLLLPQEIIEILITSLESKENLLIKIFYLFR